MVLQFGQGQGSLRTLLPATASVAFTQPLEELPVSRGYAWQLESTVGDFEAFPSFDF
jgi:hypothetical protein